MERGEVDRPAAAVHPAHSNTPPTPLPPFINRRGSLVGGAVNAQRRAASKQQQQSRTLPATTPLASQAGGVPVGLTVSAQVRHALDLYSQYVGAGKWSKLVIEQRSDGEHVSLHSRPMAAAASVAAAPTGRRKKRRRPNQKRLERQQRRRIQRSERRQQEPARHVSSDRQQATASSSPAIHTLTPAAAVFSDSLQQMQQWIGTPRAAPSYAAVAASPPRQKAAISSQQPRQAHARATPAAQTPQSAAESSSSQQQQQTARRTWAAMPAATATAIRLVSTVQSSPVISPSLTRARKKLRAMSDSEVPVFQQLDGAISTPPSPDETTSSSPPPQRPGATSEPPEPLKPPGSPLVSAPRQKETGKSALTLKLDRLHRETHAGMHVKGCKRCENGVT